MRTLPFFVRRICPASHLNNERSVTWSQKGRLEKRNVQDYALWSLLGHRCRPFYSRDVLYTCPAYHVLALLTKHMLPIKRILFVKRIFSCCCMLWVHVLNNQFLQYYSQFHSTCILTQDICMHRLCELIRYKIVIMISSSCISTVSHPNLSWWFWREKLGIVCHRQFCGSINN